uniref:Olfactory receptor family 5 subfamily B member 21 n=1 Tax=Rhinolophus ferrumequinum TaxID=59479 RepID=A0A671E310_RHIFE
MTSNSTEVTEFILLGLTDDPNIQVPLLLLLLFIYLLTLAGNGAMMTIIHSDSHLHALTYFFLSNLSFVDLGDSSAVAPKMVAALQSGNKVISYNGCAAQFFVGFARSSSTSWPAWSMTTMQLSVCALLAIGSYICGFLNASIHTADTFRFSFCGSNVITLFFCNIPPLLALSCSNTRISKLVVFFVIGFNVFSTLLVILISYLFIYIAIQRMSSAKGQKKDFSTCASHLTTVSIFHGTVIFLYLQPPSSQSMDMDKTASLFYTVVIPVLNSLIYSLRNQEVKNTLWKILNKLYPQSLSVSRRQAGNQRRNLPSGKMSS